MRTYRELGFASSEGLDDRRGVRTVMFLMARPSGEAGTAPSDPAASVKVRDPKAPL